MREVGIETVSCSALLALRIRVSMSATGSVIIAASPARLRHAGDRAVVRELAQADPAEAELPVHRARAPAAVAPAVLPRGELLRARGLHDQAFLGQGSSCFLCLGAEREAEPAQERKRLVV